MRLGDFKLIEWYEDMRVELYNLTDDVGEHHDLAAERPEKAAELRALLHDWRADVNARMPEPNPDYDPNAKPPAKKPKDQADQEAKSGQRTLARSEA